MMLGMNLLVAVVAGSASLITVLEGRTAILRLHESTARQAGVALQGRVDDAGRALVAAELAIADGADPAERLTCLQNAFPAIQAAALVGPDGVELVRVPPDPVSDPAEWPGRAAWDATQAGESYSAAPAASDEPLVLAEPLTDGAGMLVAEVDAGALWGEVLAAEMGDEGYIYVANADGTLLATGPDQSADRDPAEFQVVQNAAQGESAARLYRGLVGDWVIGRAAPVPGAAYITVTETPLASFFPTVARVIALWVMALVITAITGEWLVRRILQAVLAPLDRLSEGARAVSARDYRYRIRLPSGTESELVGLAQAFNRMIVRLQESQRQIDAYTDEMQEIVDQRARELARKAMQLEVAADVSRKIATILDPRALAREVTALIQQRFEVYHVEILLLDEDSGLLRSSHDRSSRLPAPPVRLHDSESSVVAWVARHGVTLYVPDVTEEPRYRRNPDLPASRCALAIPLTFGNRVIGVLNLEADHAHAFPRDEIAVLEGLAYEIAVYMHNAQVFDALETANRELAQATMQAKQANTLKSRFLFNASHKLRTPLNAIIGYSETMLSGIYGDLPEVVQDRQQRILQNGRILQGLVEDMLDLSALETGQLTLNLLWFDLVPLLEEVMQAANALHQAAYADHELTLRLDLMHLTEPLPPVWADVDRLRYILINLLSNAIKFTPAGEVVMRAEAREGRVLIQVRDTGPGIPDDILRYLFEPFQHQRGTTESAGRGTGLGLPVARLLAMRHGGDLTVESVLNEGSTFTLWLPRHPDGAPDPPEDLRRGR